MNRKNVIKSLILIFAWNLCSFAQNYNPPYPRLVFQRPTEGNVGGSCAQFFSRYDIAIFYGSGQHNEVVADQIRILNPATIILAETKQGVWPGNDPPEFFMLRSTNTRLTSSTKGGESEIIVNSTDGFLTSGRDRFALINGNDWITYTNLSLNKFEGIPETGEFAVAAHPAGAKIKTPIRFSGFGFLINISRFVLKAENKTAWQYLIDKRFEKVNFSKYDGSFWDAFRVEFWKEEIPDIDIDLNDVNDQSEHGMSWINAEWSDGVRKMLEYERKRLKEVNPTKPAIVTVNSGSIMGEETSRYILNYANGGLWEGFMRFATDFESTYKNMVLWMNEGPDPLTYLIEDYVKENKLEEGRNDFAYMRYGLTVSLLGDAYYGRNFGDWYYISLWYDEFDAKLGYPTTEAHQIGNGANVRFFDKGAVICNPTGENIIVTQNDLSALPGYSGPYYRFKGGQNPGFNTGEIFTKVDLYGSKGNRPKYNRGDGIIIFKQPTTVVSDIIIGNCYNNDTSPGSNPVELEGGWENVNTKLNDPVNYNPCYSQWDYSFENNGEGIGYAFTYGGRGETTATYRPSVGVAGFYAIYEWHGWVGDSPSESKEASNVPFEVFVDGNLKLSTFIDQSTNYGQWNKVIIVELPAGKNNYVKINNNRVNGLVIADALKFKYLGTDVDADQIPPDSPKDVKIEKNGK